MNLNMTIRAVRRDSNQLRHDQHIRKTMGLQVDNQQHDAAT
jgi:hypothetical protein